MRRPPSQPWPVPAAGWASSVAERVAERVAEQFFGAGSLPCPGFSRRKFCLRLVCSSWDRLSNLRSLSPASAGFLPASIRRQKYRDVRDVRNVWEFFKVSDILQRERLALPASRPPSEPSNETHSNSVDACRAWRYCGFLAKPRSSQPDALADHRPPAT